MKVLKSGHKKSDFISKSEKWHLCTSSVASLICHEGQSERTFPIFPPFPDFFPLFPDFLPLFPNFWQILHCQGGTLPPSTPSGYATESYPPIEFGGCVTTSNKRPIQTNPQTNKPTLRELPIITKAVLDFLFWLFCCQNFNIFIRHIIIHIQHIARNVHVCQNVKNLHK